MVSLILLFLPRDTHLVTSADGRYNLWMYVGKMIHVFMCICTVQIIPILPLLARFSWCARPQKSMECNLISLFPVGLLQTSTILLSTVNHVYMYKPCIHHIHNCTDPDSPLSVIKTTIDPCWTFLGGLPTNPMLVSGKALAVCHKHCKVSRFA